MNGCCAPTFSGTPEFNNGTASTSVDGSPTPLRPMILFATAMSLFSLVLMFLYCTYWRRSQGLGNPAAGASNASPSGLGPAILESIPVFVFASSSSSSSAANAGRAEQSRPQEECPVCLAQFLDREKGRVLPPCLHKFHLECVDPWLREHANCPVCRGTIELPRVHTVICKAV